MNKTIIISGASSGFGAMIARELAGAGHVVHAGMRDIEGRNADAANGARRAAAELPGDIRPLELDVTDQGSVDRAVAKVVAESGGLDVVVHNAGHMVLGPSESFTVEQLAAAYDVNVLSTQRLNLAVLPYLRDQGQGLLVWIGSSSSRGGTPPYLGPYFAAKAAEDALAVSYAVELSRFGIATTIVVPGSFTTGTNHFANAGSPQRPEIAAEYDERLPGLMDDVGRRLAALSPEDADPTDVARRVREVVDAPVGTAPFRVYVDPADDGAEEVFRHGDDVRHRFYERIDMVDLLTPTQHAYTNRLEETTP